MVLNKPKFMKPSTNKEECTIDITADEMLFSCIVDGNESINAWQIVIYDIIDDKKVYDTGKIILESSFYPVDEKNRNVVFTKNIKQYPNTITEDSFTEKINSFENRAEAYYWTITLWGRSGCTTTSYQEVFYANKMPNVSFWYKYEFDEDYKILSDGGTIASRACTFKAVYEQENGVQLKRYGWKITDTDSGQVFTDTISKNQIYGSVDNIVCNYNGFLNGGNYSVELFIETQNNKKITPPPLDFSVSYNSTYLSSDFKVETLNSEPAIMLDWNEALVISGVLKDVNNNIVNINDTVFKTNYPVNKQCSIKIPKRSKVIYDSDSSLNFDIKEDSYIAFSTQLLSDSNTEIILFFAEGHDDIGNEIIRILSYVNGEFKYNVAGQNGILKTATHKVKNRPSKYVWYNIFMSPLVNTGDDEYSVELNIFEGKVIDCFYPSEDLYPREDFYPTFGKWDNLKEV